MAKPDRLNLGCGDRYWPGFINVDIAHGDVQADVRKLEFKDVSEIHAIHLFEHFYRWEIDSILNNWKSCLKPGGLLVLEMPCLEKVIKLTPQAMLLGLFGEPRYQDIYMTHKWCWSAHEITEVLKASGFTDIQVTDALFHKPARDMRVTSRSPNAL